MFLSDAAVFSLLYCFGPCCVLPAAGFVWVCWERGGSLAVHTGSSLLCLLLRIMSPAQAQYLWPTGLAAPWAHGVFWTRMDPMSPAPGRFPTTWAPGKPTDVVVTWPRFYLPFLLMVCKLHGPFCSFRCRSWKFQHGYFKTCRVSQHRYSSCSVRGLRNALASCSLRLQVACCASLGLEL